MKYLKKYVYPVKVQFDDCDMQGIAYHPKLLSFFERARCHALEEEGFTYRDLLKENIGMVLADMNLKFIKPLEYSTEYYIVTSVVGVRMHSIKVHQIIVASKPSLEEINKLDMSALQKLPTAYMLGSIRLACVSVDKVEPISSNHPFFVKMGYQSTDDKISFKHPFLAS